jgi:hypothetical protein
MAFLRIAGVYRVTGTEPDGDSIRFVPDDPARWALVPGTNRVRVNSSGGAQLRLDAIDALETHYTPLAGSRLHQPLALAHAARDELLSWLGFRGIVRTGEKITAVAEDSVRGFVLTGGADLYGRCIAFAGRGEPPAGGDLVDVGPGLLRRTANHRLLATGLAYPTYYLGLPVELRSALTTAVAAARPAKGLWPQDLTQAGVEVAGLSTITDDAVLMPKLFRRLADFLHLNGEDPSLAGFVAYLTQRDDRVLVLDDARYTTFAEVVEVRGQRVRLTVAPEQLVFEEA